MLPVCVFSMHSFVLMSSWYRHILIEIHALEGKMYRQETPKNKQPALDLKAEILIDGIMLRACIPKDLECKVMVAMRNSEEKKCLKSGVLEIWFPCLRNSTPSEKARKILAFCRWLTQRAEINITASM